MSVLDAHAKSICEKSHGFVHASNKAIQEEAEYFRIKPLHRWVKEKGYLQAVTIQCSAEMSKGKE